MNDFRQFYDRLLNNSVKRRCISLLGYGFGFGLREYALANDFIDMCCPPGQIKFVEIEVYNMPQRFVSQLKIEFVVYIIFCLISMIHINIGDSFPS